MTLDEYVQKHSGGNPITFGQYGRYIEGWQNQHAAVDKTDCVEFKHWVIGRTEDSDVLKEVYNKTTLMSAWGYFPKDSWEEVANWMLERRKV